MYGAIGVLVAVSVAADPAPATVRIEVDSGLHGAVVTVGSHRLMSGGATRVFTSPPIDAGRELWYELTAATGAAKAKADVPVRAGETTVVRLTGTAELPRLEVVAAAEEKPIFGLDAERVAASPDGYTLSGRTVSRGAALLALADSSGIPADGAQPFLVVVGSDRSRVVTDWEQHGDLRKYHDHVRFQAYEATDPMIRDRDSGQQLYHEGVHLVSTTGDLLWTAPRYDGAAQVLAALRRVLPQTPAGPTESDFWKPLIVGVFCLFLGWVIMSSREDG